MSDEFGFKEEEMYFPGGFEKENPLGSYVFVQVEKDQDFELMWPKIADKKYVSAFNGFLKIPDDQFQQMIDSHLTTDANESSLDNIFPYDIVKIPAGPYAKLYGVVTSIKKNDFYEIGFRFFTGPQFKDIQRNQLIRVKSLFDIWKFPVY